MMKRFSPPSTKFSSKTIAIAVFVSVLLLLVVWYYYGPRISAFGNTSNLKDTVNSLDIIMFTSKDCKYCPQQIAAFQSAGLLDSIVVKDVGDENNKKEAMRFGVIGFPYFISLKNKTATIGYEEDVQKIVDNLKPRSAAEAMKQSGKAQGTAPQKALSDAGPQVYVLTRSGCGWCDKAKKDISSKNIDTSVVLPLEVSSPEGQAVVDKYNVKVAGVPIFVNAKDGTTVVGFKPIEEIMKTFGVQ